MVYYQVHAGVVEHDCGRRANDPEAVRGVSDEREPSVPFFTTSHFANMLTQSLGDQHWLHSDSLKL